jgi:hypothetical protein
MYVLAGFGLYTSPKAGIYFNSLRSRNWKYGVEAFHFSGNGGITNVPSSKWGNNKINIDVNHFFKKYSLNFYTGYKNNMVHYYGGLAQNDHGLTADEIKQNVNRFDAGLRVKSYLKDNDKINFEGGIYYQHLSDRFNTTENRFIIDGNVTGNIKSDFSYKGGFNFDYNKNNSFINYLNKDNIVLDLPVSLVQQNSLIVIDLAVFKQFGDFKTKLGLDFAYGKKFHIYPIIDLSYTFLNQSITPYIGVDGKMIRNTFSNFFDINPYTISSAEITNTNRKFRFYGGIKGRISNQWSYDFAYSYESYNDFALFVNDTLYSYQNRFNVIYDDIKRQHIYATINYQDNEKLKVSLIANFYGYTPSVQLFAWQEPNVKIDFLLNYNLSNKFLVGFDLFYVGKRMAASLYPVEGITVENGVYPVTLDAYFDLNLKFEYRYNKRLSAFIEFNNLLSSKYALWYKYQVQPFFGLIGVTFSF